VLSIVPGYIDAHDVVALRKRSQVVGTRVIPAGCRYDAYLLIRWLGRKIPKESRVTHFCTVLYGSVPDNTCPPNSYMDSRRMIDDFK
jgi:hypothetical protein